MVYFFLCHSQEIKSSLSSVPRLTTTGSTDTWILSVDLLQLSKFLACLTAATYTSFVAVILASSCLTCKSAQVKLCRDECTWHFICPHTCLMAFSLGWAGGRQTASWPYWQMVSSIVYWGFGLFCWQRSSSLNHVAAGGMGSLWCSTQAIRLAFLVTVVGQRLSSMSWVW